MRVLILGAAGFIGSRLASALLARGRLRDAAGEPRPITELVLADARPVSGIAADRTAVRTEVGDCADPAFLQHLFRGGVDSVFPLAATLTTEAETDFARGLRVNLLALVQLLEACRAQERAPRLVYASSIAAFGGALPDVVDDTIARTPQTSYGTHKAVAELLITDYSRHGFIDGRALRLPIVLVRPGAPNPAVSDRIAALVREPLAGRDVDCPVGPDTRMPVASVRRVAEALLAVHDLPADVFGATRALNLPALTVTARDMAQALERFRGGSRLGRIRFAPEPALQAIVDGWPGVFVSELAARNGIAADASFDDVIRCYIEDYLQA